MLTLLQFFEQSGQAAQIAVARIIERYAKLAPILPIRSLGHLVHLYNRETSLGEVGRRAVNQPAPDSAPGNTSPVNDPLIMLTRKIKTDHRLAQLDPNARGTEAQRGTRAIARVMDDAIINDNRMDNIDNLLGLKQRCVGSQLIETATNGATLTVEHVEAALDAVQDQGSGKMLVMSRPAYRQLVADVRSNAGGATVADVTSEIPVYEGAKIVIIGDKLDGTSILGFTETQGSNAETCSALVIAPGNDEVELSGVKLLMASNSIELIDEGTRDSMKIDVLEIAFGIAVYDDTAIARIKGIAKAA